MGKILFWLGVFAAIFIALKVIAVVQRKGTLNKSANSPPPTNASEPPSSQKEAPKSLPSLIACEKCGLHLPRLEAIEKQGHYFCSMEHAD